MVPRKVFVGYSSRARRRGPCLVRSQASRNGLVQGRVWHLLLRICRAYELVRGGRRPYYRALQVLVYCCRVYTVLVSIRRSGVGRSPDVFVLPLKGSRFCLLTSSDISVSALRARLMAHAVFAGTMVVVEGLVIPPPPSNRTSSTPAAAEEVRSWVWLRSNPYRSL